MNYELIRTFAAVFMSIKAKRTLFSRLMLSVFLPMLLLSTLHIHQEVQVVGDVCLECVNHTPHAGHLSFGVIHYDDCVLCQFTSLPFVAAVTVVLSLAALVCEAVFPLQLRHVRLVVCRVSIPRAPPVI